MDGNSRGVVIKGRVRGRVSNVRRKKQKNSQIKEDCPAYITTWDVYSPPRTLRSLFSPVFPPTMTDSDTIKRSHCGYNTAEWGRFCLCNDR